MKVKEVKEELKALAPTDLESKIDELRRELLTLRLQHATTPVKSFASKQVQLRRSIACALTLLKQKKS